MKKIRKGSHYDMGLSFFLLLGTVLGTLFCNMMTEPMKEELCFLEESLLRFPVGPEGERWKLFWDVLLRRAGMFLLLQLSVMSPAGNHVFLLGSFFSGFASSLFLSALTMVRGSRGLWIYLVFLFPQCICYILLLVLLWAENRRGPGKRPAETLIKAGFFALGVLMETVINPWLLTFVL